MSSAYIASQMDLVRSEMQNTEEHIQALTEKRQEQELERDRFVNERDSYLDMLTYNEKRKDNIEAIEVNVIMAKRMNLRLQDLKNDRSVQFTRLLKIEDAINQEIQQTADDLEEARQHLASLKSNLAQLEIDYKNALAAEEAEREAQRLAAAAALKAQ